MKSASITNAKESNFDNYQELHHLLTNAFEYMNGIVDPPSSMLRLDHKALREKAQQETLLIARHQNELVGCIFIQSRSDACYAGKFAVKSEYRKHGIGSALLLAAQQWAQSHGYRRIDLETRVELTDNHQYFEKQGFTKTAENAHAGFSRPTSFVFSKCLSRNTG